MRVRLTLAFGFTVIAAAVAIQADDDFEPTQTREFDILADDRPVGVHVMRIREDGNRAAVRITSDVEVRVLLYRYVYQFQSSESWNGARLTAFESQTNDNGTKTSVQFKLESERGVLRFQEQVVKTESPHQTTSYSRLPPGLAETRTLRLVKLDEGGLVATTWSPREETKLRVNQQSIRCRKWMVDGELKAELWFDDAGWLVRQRTVERGHRSELRLTSIQRERDK